MKVRLCLNPRDLKKLNNNLHRDYYQDIYQASVVQKVDRAIRWINLYPVGNAIGFPNTYPLDSDLSGGYSYPTFEQPGPGPSMKLPLFRGKKNSSVVDTKKGYWHVELDYPSSLLCTFNTPVSYTHLTLPTKRIV